MKLIDLLASEVRASADYNSNVQVAPSVILWTDKQRQWESALPLLKAAMPELVVLGDYAPEQKTGPAIWIKCVIEGVLPEVSLPDNYTPIIYLPGVERRDLRAIANCPEELMPLAELQYRGCWWIYSNAARDWTVKAFLVSKNGGVDLDVAGDDKTQQAMLRVLPEILDSKPEDLSNRRLEAADFNKLVSNDPVRDLLSWMNASKACRERWSESRWLALVGICETEYHFNPEKDGELTAAELLCQRQGVWENVWQRYLESCHHYPFLPELLLKVEADLAADGSSYPVINNRQEVNLESSLFKLQSMNSGEVRTSLLELEAEHAKRRDWIWFELGQAPLAGVLEHLNKVALLTQKVFSGTQPEEMADLYRDKYWQADDSMLKALAYPLTNDQQVLVQKLLTLIYTPWLDQVTRNFQDLVRVKGYPGNNQCDALLDEVVERIEELLAAGWKKIRLVTDHGWILTPEPMAKVDLPKHLTETRWGRCAVIKDSIGSGYQQVNWYWNSQVSVAVAPGASCFKTGQHYDHGGLSLQECFTPVIEILNNISQSQATKVSASLADLRWVGLICRVQAETSAAGVIAVLRTHPADPESEISKRKPLKEGKCSLMVDDEYEGTPAVLVLLDEQNNVLAKKPTLVGDE